MIWSTTVKIADLATDGWLLNLCKQLMNEYASISDGLRLSNFATNFGDQLKDDGTGYKIDFIFSIVYSNGSLCTMVPLKLPSCRYKYTAAL